MAYTAGNLRNMLSQVDGLVPKLWFYSGTDSNATVEGSNYFSDAVHLGVKPGDVLLYVNTSTPAAAWFVFTVVSTTATTVGSTPATFS